MSMIVLDPTPGKAVEPAQMANRLETLAGATIGLLDNGKFNVQRFLDHVEAILREEHGVREVVRRRKPNQNAPVTAEMLADLLGTDAVISAVGD
jgi:hypothetical protein